MFALAAIEDELVAPDERSRLVEVVEQVMLEEPRWWAGYYEGEASAQHAGPALQLQRPDALLLAASGDPVRPGPLVANLRRSGIPLPLLSAHLPAQYDRVRRGELEPEPQALVVDRVRDVLRDYAAACGAGGKA